MAVININVNDDFKAHMENMAISEGVTLEEWILKTLKNALNEPTADISTRRFYFEEIGTILNAKNIKNYAASYKNPNRPHDNVEPHFSLYIEGLNPKSDAPISLTINMMSRDFTIRFECVTRSPSDKLDGKRAGYIKAFEQNEVVLKNLGFRQKHGSMSYVIEMRKSSKSGEATKLTPQDYVNRALTLKQLLGI